ncbi:MAG: hypothetical protein ABI550_08945 [Ignavibacteriaceae bacterium]
MPSKIRDYYFILIMKNKIQIFLSLLILLFSFLGCGKDQNKLEDKSDEDSLRIEYSPSKDGEIQRFNLEVKRKQASIRFECDTISLIEYVLDNYPKGTYLVDFDKTFTYNIPQSAVIYYNNDKSYIFGIIAKSRQGERLIETKNIVGYDQSFIDLDSTELGTAFFYICLFHCNNGNFNTIWEAPIPSHGGFNSLSFQMWNYKNTPFLKVDFHYAQGVGHIDYNYFLVDGLTSQPHLLMTYEGINFKRTIANINNDKYPDYYEYVYYDSADKIKEVDSVAFTWNAKDSVYVNSRNKRQTRPY